MVLALSGGRCNCRTWVPRARDPGPGRADPKRRHDGRPSRATADGRSGMGSVRGPILSLEGHAGRGRTWFPGPIYRAARAEPGDLGPVDRVVSRGLATRTPRRASVAACQLQSAPLAAELPRQPLAS
jgi:hypothetical protein